MNRYKKDQLVDTHKVKTDRARLFFLSMFPNPVSDSPWWDSGRYKPLIGLSGPPHVPDSQWDVP